MNTKLRIAAVEPANEALTLLITWSDRRQQPVNLAEPLRTYSVLEALQDPALFQQVQVGEWGFDVVWPGDIELSAITLYRLAMEQAGEAMAKTAFRDWMQRHGLSLTGAAQALHLTRRTITAYSSGPNPIPYHIALACKGWEVMQAGAMAVGVSEPEPPRYKVEPPATKRGRGKGRPASVGPGEQDR
ncbi:MAG: DUF2442 domain-containing protein [Pseudomonas sp.]